jgi:hypothetical protein
VTRETAHFNAFWLSLRHSSAGMLTKTRLVIAMDIVRIRQGPEKLAIGQICSTTVLCPHDLAMVKPLSPPGSF